MRYRPWVGRARWSPPCYIPAMHSDPATVLRSIARATARDRALIAALPGEGERMAEAADKVRALLEAVRVFESLGVPYALIGGVAVGLHAGVPRATLDTDFAVHTRHRGARLLEAFAAGGFTLRGEHAHSVNLRHSGGEPVQLAFDESFNPMLDRSEVFDFEGTVLRIVAKGDLIEMKRRAAADPGRRRSEALRDRADIELLRGDVPEPDEGW